jgi:hypothetical protein
MAELLVLTKQRMNRSMFPGDVVTVQPDGWAWGRAERGPESDPMWRVIAVPGVPVSAFTEFLEPVTNNGRPVLFRRVHLDLTRIGDLHTLEFILAVRMEKTLIPLLS